MSSNGAFEDAIKKLEFKRGDVLVIKTPDVREFMKNPGPIITNNMEEIIGFRIPVIISGYDIEALSREQLQDALRMSDEAV